MYFGRGWWRGLLLAVCWLTCVSVQAQTSRHALVVGINDYKSVAVLDNAINDASDLAQALSGLSFKVSRLINADRETMFRGLASFRDQIAPGDEVVVFFAGHAVQLNDRNYLLPLDVPLGSEDETAMSSFDLDDVLQDLHRTKARSTIVILDACRDDPFAGRIPLRQTGLAQPSIPPSTLIVYATSPGEKADDGDGRNGLYTSHLLKHIKRPGLSIEVMLKDVRADVMRASGDKQVPWDSSSLRERFTFVPEKALDLSSAALPEDLRKRADSAFWQAAARANSVLDLEEYLSRFPQGQHVDEARKQLSKRYAEGEQEIAKAREALISVRADQTRWSSVMKSLSTLPKGQRDFVGFFSQLHPGMTDEQKQALVELQRTIRAKPYPTIMMGTFSQSGAVLVAEVGQGNAFTIERALTRDCEYQRRGVGDRFPMQCVRLYKDGDWEFDNLRAMFEKMAALDVQYFYTELTGSLRAVLRKITR